MIVEKEDEEQDLGFVSCLEQTRDAKLDGKIDRISDDKSSMAFINTEADCHVSKAESMILDLLTQ